MVRIALVSGSAGCIGRRYAEGLAEDGATIVVADLNIEGAEETAAMIHSNGGKAVAQLVDNSEPKSAQAFAAYVRKEFGRLDILVNNPAFFRGMKASSAMAVYLDYWRKIFHINLDGVLIMTQALAR